MKRNGDQWEKFWREITVRPNIPPPKKWLIKVAEAIQQETQNQIASYVRKEAQIYNNAIIQNISLRIEQGDYLPKK